LESNTAKINARIRKLPITTVFWETKSAKTDETFCPNPISMLVLLVSHLARPRTPIIADKVITKGCIFRLAISRPLVKPTRPPAKTAAVIAITIWVNAPVPGSHLVIIRAVTDAERARTLPTLRSIPAVRIIKDYLEPVWFGEINMSP